MGVGAVRRGSVGKDSCELCSRCKIYPECGLSRKLRIAAEFGDQMEIAVETQIELAVSQKDTDLEGRGCWPRISSHRGRIGTTKEQQQIVFERASQELRTSA